MIFQIKIIYFKTIAHKRNIFLVRYFYAQTCTEENTAKAAHGLCGE